MKIKTTELRPESEAVQSGSPGALARMCSPSSLTFSVAFFLPDSAHSAYPGNHTSFFLGLELGRH